MARQICCHQSDHRPLYECQHLNHCIQIVGGYLNLLPYSHTNAKCGNLMHADCIEKHGKCHHNSGVKKWIGTWDQN